MSTNKIEIKHLSVDYTERGRRFNALHDVSFGVGAGEFVSVIGASGCGKSTLLSVLEDIYQAADGSVEIDGHALHGTGRERGVVFQHYSLFPWMTTRSNIAFGLKQVRHDINRRERLKIADEFLGKVGLEGFGKKYPSQLSGGMQQRAAIARALAMDTEILLMDEPMAGMNTEEKEDLARFILDVREAKRIPIVLVEHDMGVVMDLADRIAVLDFGRKIADGTPKEIQANPAVHKAYLGEGVQ